MDRGLQRILLCFGVRRWFDLQPRSGLSRSQRLALDRLAAQRRRLRKKQALSVEQGWERDGRKQWLRRL